MNMIHCETCDLIPVSITHTWFLEELFSYSDVKKFYVLRDDHASDIKSFVSYLIYCNEHNRGLNYIIYDYYGNEMGFITSELVPDRATSEPVWNVGYAIHPKFRCQGYATDALRTFTDYLLNNFTFTEVTLDISIDNEVSSKVAQNAGFTTKDGVALYDMDHPEIGARKRWIKQDSNKRVILFNQACSFYRCKNYSEAIRYYKQALNESYQAGTPYTDAQIYANIGMAESSLGYYQEAYNHLVMAQNMGLSNPSITKELLWLKNNCGLGW